MKTSNSNARRGFTLIEVLAVIVILGILMVVLLPRLTDMMQSGKSRATEVWITSIAAAADQFEQHFGDFPPSQFQEKWGAAPNLTNLGSEVLVISLWSTEWGGATLADDKFVNLDSDDSKKPLTRFPSTALQELKDEWGNPIAYFHRRDYGRTDTYMVTDDETGLVEERQVKAFMNPATKTYFNSNAFQVISCGPDSKFNTDDDLTNFKRD